jgi:cytochrome c oxidase subunit 4
MKAFQPRLLIAYLALLGLLALTVAASSVLSGPIGLATGIAIAIIKTAVIYAVFMGLAAKDGLARIFATGAGFWLLALIFLTFGDYVMR